MTTERGAADDLLQQPQVVEIDDVDATSGEKIGRQSKSGIPIRDIRVIRGSNFFLALVIARKIR